MLYVILFPSEDSRLNNRSTAPIKQHIIPEAGSPGTAPRGPSAASVALRLFLSAAALIAAVVFLLIMQVEFTYEYRPLTIPARAAQAQIGEISDKLLESEIPAPPDPFAKLPDYDFTAPVPEAPAEQADFFSDTVFIGDSRTVGLIMYTKLKPIDFSGVGLNVSTIWTKSYIRLPDASGTLRATSLSDALTAKAGEFKSVYLALGLNELGWNPSVFAKSFESTIDTLRSLTDVPIYVQLILPVTQKASDTSEFGITNEKAALFNEEIRRIAAEKEVFLLDPTALFALEDGTLDPTAASDGIHLQPAAYTQIVDYYRTHTVDPADYANLARRYLADGDGDAASDAPGKPDAPEVFIPVAPEPVIDENKE